MPTYPAARRSVSSARLRCSLLAYGSKASLRRAELRNKRYIPAVPRSRIPAIIVKSNTLDSSRLSRRGTSWMQNRAFLKESSVENLSFFQREMVAGGYLSSYENKNNENKTRN